MPDIKCPFCEKKIRLEDADFPRDPYDTALRNCPECGKELKVSWYPVFEAAIPEKAL